MINVGKRNCWALSCELCGDMPFNLASGLVRGTSVSIGVLMCLDQPQDELQKTDPTRQSSHSS